MTPVQLGGGAQRPETDERARDCLESAANLVSVVIGGGEQTLKRGENEGRALFNFANCLPFASPEEKT